MKKLFVLYIGLCLSCISAFAQLQQADGKQSTPPELLENIACEYFVTVTRTYLSEDETNISKYFLLIEKNDEHDSNLKFTFVHHRRGYIKANTEDGVNFEINDFDIKSIDTYDMPAVFASGDGMVKEDSIFMNFSLIDKYAEPYHSDTVLVEIKGNKVLPPPDLTSILAEYDVVEVDKVTGDYEGDGERHEYVLEMEENDEPDSNLKFRYTCHGYDAYVKAKTKDGVNFEIFSQEIDDGNGMTGYISGEGTLKGDSIFMNLTIRNPDVEGTLQAECKGERRRSPVDLGLLLGEYDVEETALYPYSGVLHTYEYVLKFEENYEPGYNLKFDYYGDIIKANTEDGIHFEFSQNIGDVYMPDIYLSGDGRVEGDSIFISMIEVNPYMDSYGDTINIECKGKRKTSSVASQPVRENGFDVYFESDGHTLSVAGTTGEDRLSLTLTDMCGRCVLPEAQLGGNSVQVPDLPRGMYLYVLSSDGRKVASGKVARW